jgi:hypothetical protein
MIEVLRKHSQMVADQARELGEALAEADPATMPALIQAVGLVDLEDVRARLSRAADALLAHAAPATSHERR